MIVGVDEQSLGSGALRKATIVASPMLVTTGSVQVDFGCRARRL
jgi:hypothetical protein